MKRLILLVSIAFVLGLNSVALGLARQGNAEAHLANSPIKESKLENFAPESSAIGSKKYQSLSETESIGRGDPADKSNPISPARKSISPTPLANKAVQPIVLIDQAHGGNHSQEVTNFVANLTAWGFQVKFLTTRLGAGDLADVDIFITFPPDKDNSTAKYTSAELTALQTWFDSGYKSVWATGDSDFGDPAGDMASEANKILNAIGSQVLIEQSSIESDLNAGMPYRVRAGIFNLVDEVPAQLIAQTSYGISFMHGPAPLIGINETTGVNITIEGNEAYFKVRNVSWVVKAVQNATHDSTIRRWSANGLPYQIHANNSQGSFVMFTTQEKAGAHGTSRIIVTSEAIFSDYKMMFNDPGEFSFPNDNVNLTKAAMKWLARFHAPISIQNDADFSTQATAEKWPGDGSKASPYEIAGYRITNSTGDLISISGTTFYFRIADCLLNGLNGDFGAISFGNVGNGTVEHNTIFNTSSGVALGGTNHSIVNNTIHDVNTYGIWTPGGGGSNNHTITGNEIYNTGGSGHNGINIEASNHNTITLNVIHDGDGGIGIGTGGTLGSNSNIVKDNTLYSNLLYGIALTKSENNSIINNSISDTSNQGIQILSGSGNNTISGNVIYNNSQGIQCFSVSDSNTISGNVIYNNSQGILFSGSHNTIENNLVYNNTGTGISLGSSDNNTIAHNVVYISVLTRDRWGISLSASNNNSLFNNTVYHHEFAMQLDGASDYNLISNNTVFDNINGILIDGNHNWIANNSVSNSESHGITVTNSLNNTIVNNTLEDNGWVAIHLGSATASTIINNIVTNTSNHGVLIDQSNNSLVANNIIHDNFGDGISLGESNNNTIAHNELYNNKGWGGINLGDADNNTILNNIVSDHPNGNGIILGFSTHTLVANNTIYNNRYRGIRCEFSSSNSIFDSNTIYDNSEDGIWLWNSTTDNKIINNTVFNNIWNGILLETSATDNVIANNTVSANIQNGIDLRNSANNNLIVNNSLYNNKLAGIYLGASIGSCSLWGNILATNEDGNAWDAGTNNQWNAATHGNWWSDYGGPDWNHDGIGDIPYHIPGGTGAQDHYPLFNVTDSILPTVNAPSDVSYEEGTTGHSLAWQPADVHPYWFNITMDGTLVVDQGWDGAGISLNIDGLAVGTHTYILVVYDRLGSSASDSVMVTVTEAPPASSEPHSSEDEEPSRTSPGFTVSVLLIVGISFIIIRSRRR
ncbi:MAG: right-handed parallel beta-helix repeat-containing protein [Candidatus Heimdallarchaeota archaeon]